MNKKNSSKWTYFFIVLFVALMVMFLFTDLNNNIEEISANQTIELIDSNVVESVYFYNGNGRILLIATESIVKDPKAFPSEADFVFSCSDMVWEKILERILEYNRIAQQSGDAQINLNAPPIEASWLETLMPIIYIAFALVLVFFVFKMFTKSNTGAMNFGKSKARLTANIKVRFQDIAGADEEKQELQEIVEFLKHPQRFTELGARIPKGILLVGNPGTGKTLLARAVAGESNVPFLSISGSDFVEMFVGVGASRVRDLFEQAKKSLPCIVFIDEIDAVGRQRGAGLGGGNDEREQTLNQLLVEMDGFEANEGIIVLAATNRSDVLDPALLRPGRFDRQIYVHVPDVKGREGIIKIHAKNKPIDSEVDYQVLARITRGFTGADLENMLNEAAILAARAGRPKILMQDITEGINKVLMGPQKKSLVVTERDKLITAYHESGHAIIGKLLEHCEEVQEVSIISRGSAAGYTMSRPDSDDNHMAKKKLNDSIAMLMGGRLAEELFMEDICTGASEDIKRATELARKMVAEFGMSEKFGFMSFESSGEIFVGRDYQNKNEYSEKTASEIDEEVKRILDENYIRARKILSDNAKLVHEMAKLLLKEQTIYKEEVDMIMQGQSHEEISTHMQEVQQKRKIKEDEAKIEVEKQRKIKEINLKLKTAQMYLNNKIISDADYKLIQEESNEALRAINEEGKEETNPQVLDEPSQNEEQENNQTQETKKIKENKNDKKD